MRRILPGGATLNGIGHDGDERRVVCRPLSAVVLRTSGRRATTSPQPEAVKTVALVPPPDPTPPKPTERPFGVKQVLELLTVLVGLIGAILALLATLRK